MYWFSAAFAAIALAVLAAAVPGTFELSRYAFGDNGWAVRVDGLLTEGAVPTRDFAYTYGLLTLLINRAVFAVFGATPAVTGGLILVCGAFLAVGVWRLIRATAVGIGPRLLVLLVTPVVINSGQMPSPAHALEPVFLVFALAAQAEGKLAQALTLATVAVLVKPGLGYILGLLLLMEVFTTSPTRWKSLLPATLVGGGLLVVLVATFGVQPVLKTQLPTEAGKVYRDQNCGLIHGEGRLFLQPEAGTEVMYFATTPAGMWVVATGLLTIGGLAAFSRWRSDRCARTIAILATLHVAFALFFFGNRWGWVYYPFLPFVGAAIAVDRIPRWTPGDLGRMLTPVVAGVYGLLAIAVITLYLAPNAVRAVRGVVPIGEGLVATPEFLAEWKALSESAREGRVYVLTRAGCPGALLPELDSPRAWYLSRAVAVPLEMESVRTGIARCDRLVVPDWPDHNLMNWPELLDVVKPFTVVKSRGSFKVYRRQ